MYLFKKRDAAIGRCCSFVSLSKRKKLYNFKISDEEETEHRFLVFDLSESNAHIVCQL